MKNVIINADDFGLSKSINKGIIKAHQEGILTSTSLIVNMPDSEKAIEEIENYPNLGIGLHLNLIRGKPVSPIKDIPSLINKNGYFLQNIPLFLFKIVIGEIKINEVEIELRNQMKKFKRSGLTPTHIDSESHLHLIPSIFNIVVKLAKENDVRFLRFFNPNFKNFFNKDLFIALFKKYYRNEKILTFLCLFNKTKCKKYFNCVDYTLGVKRTGHMFKETYENIFNNLKDGTAEIICHPGEIDAECLKTLSEIGIQNIIETREMELKALLDPRLKELGNKLNLKFVSFKDLIKHN